MLHSAPERYALFFPEKGALNPWKACNYCIGILSKYERDISIIKVDVLKRLAGYFNVTTDYLLGLSDVKRD